MRYRISFLLLLFCFVGMIFFSGCKTEEETAQYTLTVTLDEGVTGAPAAGSYTHSENDVVSYNYSVQSGFGNLGVTLDGAVVPVSGSVTISGNHSLNATSDIDVRGKWTGGFNTGNDYFMQITFSGNISSGTVQGNIDCVSGNGNGTYSYSDDQIQFILHFPSVDLSFNGTITEVNHMNGQWQIPSAGLSAEFMKKLPANGNWNLSR